MYYRALGRGVGVVLHAPVTTWPHVESSHTPMKWTDPCLVRLSSNFPVLQFFLGGGGFRGGSSFLIVLNIRLATELAFVYIVSH